MDHTTISSEETAHKTPRKRSFIPKAFGNTLPRTGSLLSALIPRRPSIRKVYNKRRVSKSDQSLDQQQGTFSLLPKPHDMPPVHSRHRSVDIPQRHLMKPLYPPIPKSRTLGSLETNLLYLTPETSPTRSKCSSFSSARTSNPNPNHLCVPSYQPRRAHTYGHNGEGLNARDTLVAGSYSPPPRSFARRLPRSPTPGWSSRAPADLPSENSSADSSLSVRNMSRKEHQDVMSSNAAVRRNVFTPSQIPKPGSRRLTNTFSRRSVLPAEDTHEVPPLPTLVHSLTTINTPRSAPSAPRRVPGRRESTPGGRKSSIPCPASGGPEGPKSTLLYSSVTPSGRKSSLPIPVNPTSSSGGRKSTIPYSNITPSGTKARRPSLPLSSSSRRKSSLLTSRDTPPSIRSRIPTPARPGRYAGAFNAHASGGYYGTDSSLTRRVSRPGYMPGQNLQISNFDLGRVKSRQLGQMDATSFRSRQPSLHKTEFSPITPEMRDIPSAESSPFDAWPEHEGAESPTPKAARTARLFGPAPPPPALPTRPSIGEAIPSSPTSPGLLPGRDPELAIEGVQAPEYWLGRFMSVADHVRTDDLNTKVPLARGDPSAKNHPANTGMMDDDARKKYALDRLEEHCGDEYAKGSLQSFKAEMEARERRGGRGPGRATVGDGEGNGKTGVFERLRKRSKSKGT